MATVQKSLQREALLLVFWQFMVTMALALLILVISGFTKGLSTLLGGIAYVVPQFLFTWRIFSFATVRQAQQFLMAFFLGEFAKLFLSAILFVLIVNYIPVTVSFVMIGYIAAIVSFWFVCGWHFTKSPKSKVPV